MRSPVRPTVACDGGPAKRGTPLRLLLAGAAAAVAVIIVLIGLLIWDAYRLTRAHAIQSAENLASALEHDIARNIEMYDLSLQAVADGLRLPETATLRSEVRNYVLFDRAATARDLGSMVVLDRDGRVRFESRPTKADGQAFAEFDFFRVHREHSDAGLYISAPIKNRLSDGWDIVLSRRLEGTDGEFGGVAFGSLHLEFFRQLFTAIASGDENAIALFSDQGKLLVRHPENDDLIGRTFGRAGRFPASPGQSGTFEMVSTVDGVDRLFAFRRIAKFPLVISVGISRATAFAEVSRKAVGVGAAVLVLSGLIAALGLALVSELRRRAGAERRARDSAQRYSMLAEHSFDMIVSFDPSSQTRTYISPSVRRLYGYEPEEALAMPATEIIHPDDLAAVRGALDRVKQGDQTPVVYRGRCKDGSYIWVQASLTPVQNPDSGAMEILSVVRDVSDRVRYETELRRAKEDADAASRTKSEFFAVVSHELRTPLNAIIGFTELMTNEIGGPIRNERYRSYIEDIHQSGIHLLRVINDILDLSKVEARKLEINEDVVEPGALIDSVVRLCRARIEAADLAIAIEIPPGLPEFRLDEGKVCQVLFNLIGNAVKFTPAGGRIEIRAGLDERNGLTITVADTGIGIPPEDLERVFEPFVQIDSALSRRHDGTGLGLPLVRAIMELHQGEATLRSTLGEGTEVTVSFPPDRRAVLPASGTLSAA